jgi:isochorismate pyruvate lyase
MQIKNEKEPAECADLSEIRKEIDLLDKTIISLIGKRSQYVKVAVRFKNSEVSVRDSDRVHTMIKKRREWAEENDLNADVIEKMYRDLIDHFIETEMKSWSNESNP